MAEKTIRRATKPARTPKRSSVRSARAGEVIATTRFVAFQSRWLVISIIKLLGSRRCSGLVVAHQQQTQWCWAAVSDSVSHFYDAGSTWTQCSVVNAELGQSTCCTSGSSSACNKPWYLDKALSRVSCLLSWASGVLSFATIKSLINSGRPPCARQGWSGGGGHFMAVTCYFEGILGLLAGSGSTAKRLRITDPWYGDSVVDYDVFVSGYQGSGTWTHTYRTQP